MTVIARFSKIKAFSYVIGCLAICIIMYFTMLNHPDGVSLEDYIKSKGVAFFIAGCLASIFVVLLQWTILNQLLFRQCNAIWLEGGNLFFLNTYGHIHFSKFPFKEIKSLTVGSVGSLGRRGIIAELRNGRQESIPTWLLSEPPDVVASRLRQSLCLS